MIFQRWFGPSPSTNRTVVDALYERIVASARQPALYAEWEVPDTPLGRFEMISLHLFLFMHRVRGESGPIAEIAQTLTDEFFSDVDSSVRELGIGDAGVPKRVKKLAKMFYGRAAAYGEALDKADRQELVAALTRNIRPDLKNWPGAEPLADHVIAASVGLAAQPTEEFVAGRIAFPEVGRTDR